MTTGEAARYLDVSLQTVRRWAKNGSLPVIILPSGHRRFRTEDIERLLEPVEASA